jgi:hypothetical protein
MENWMERMGAGRKVAIGGDGGSGAMCKWIWLGSEAESCESGLLGLDVTNPNAEAVSQDEKYRGYNRFLVGGNNKCVTNKNCIQQNTMCLVLTIASAPIYQQYCEVSSYISAFQMRRVLERGRNT